MEPERAEGDPSVSEGWEGGVLEQADSMSAAVAAVASRIVRIGLTVSPSTAGVAPRMAPLAAGLR
jgi:hypothetical protein